MMDGVQVILSVEDSLSAMALTDEKGLKVIPNQSLAFLEYKFFDADKNELDMKEEKEIINK